MATIKLEVAIAVREVNTSFREMEAKHRAMVAADTEVEYIEERWKLLADEDRSASLILEDLLAAQVRLGDAEYGFLTAGLNYNQSQMNYKKAVGTLLQEERITLTRGYEGNLPSQILRKSTLFEPPGAAAEWIPVSPHEARNTDRMNQAIR